ncbi:MAG: hypothetical protein UDA86_03590 [Blautia sp.]|nr:hypothetical protein [Blautia sp.]
MELVTGSQGKNHVTAEQTADFNRGIFGNAAILPIGSRMAVEIQTANRITVKDGVAVFDGREVYIGYGKNEAVNLTSGTQGMKRHDIVVVEYKKEERSGVESVALKVVLGTPNAAKATDPTVKDVDIRTGTSHSEKPFCRVRLNGTAIEGIDMLVEVKEFKKHAFANPVKTLTATEEGYALDAIMGKIIGDRLSTVENRLENHHRRTGATAYTGEYGSQWTLTTQYQDIGNSRTFNDTYFSASSGNSKITVKEGGLYLITTSITIKANGYDNIWMKILKNGIDAHSTIVVANGYTTIETHVFLTLTTGDWVSVQLSKSSDSVNTICEGGGYLQIVKFT